MKASALEFASFVVAGLVNTAVGYGAFWLANQTLGLHIALANAIGYAVALAVAYGLNRYFVFRRRAARKGSVALFLMCFLIAFGVNQVVLLLLALTTSWHPGVVQLFAMASYTIVFFFLNKFVVFGLAVGSQRSREKFEL